KISEIYGSQFNFEQFEIGGTSYDLTGSPLTDGTIAACKSSDTILIGAVGVPIWDNISVNVRPEIGLLEIKKVQTILSNLRQIKEFNSLLHTYTIKKKNIKGSDILIVRELTGGLYFGEPRERRENGTVAVDTLVYSREEIERIVDQGFKSAQIR